MTLYPKLIMDALATVTYAGTKKNLVESEMVSMATRLAWCWNSHATPTRS